MYFRTIDELLMENADVFINQWSKELDYKPVTSWDDIFGRALDEFMLYVNDEASANEDGYTIQELRDLNMFDDYDIRMEFDYFVKYSDISDFDTDVNINASRGDRMKIQRRKPVKASNTKRGGNFMKLKRKNAITCTGDDYKVKMLRQFLDKMNLNTDTWDYVQVKCNGKAINLDEGAVNLLIDYYTNVYDPKKDAYSSEYVGASNRPAPRRRSVKASTYGDAFKDIELDKDAYIQRWSEDYEGTPATSWDNIFDNVLEEFTRYADDEVSGFILEKFENGEYTADDMDNEFEQYIMWRDLGEYDQD